MQGSACLAQFFNQRRQRPAMRSFISVNLAQDIKENISETMESLKGRQWDVRWIPSGNLHITLKFLGEIRESSLQAIRNKLLQVSSRQTRFSIGLCGAGVFPDGRHPRIVWLGMPDSDRLKKLQEEIDVSMASLGFERERRLFSPHLTIGRIKTLTGTDLLMSRIETLKNKDFGNIEVSNFSLMKSELKPAGAQYAILTEFNLIEEEQ